MRFLRISALLFLAALAYPMPARSADKIPPVAWNQLEDQELSADARLALFMGGGSWRHARTKHFYYHYADEAKALEIYESAEFYYRWICHFLGVDSSRPSNPIHLFLFQDAALWNNFKRHSNPSEPVINAYSDGWDIFIFEGGSRWTSRRSLVHEMAHRLLSKVFEKPVPLFLNEGFAQIAAYKAIASDFTKNQFDQRKLPKLKTESYVPLKSFSGVNAYPADLANFYLESEWLVKFLVHRSRENFTRLLKDVSGGAGFEEALQRDYGMDLPAFEAEFKRYAVS